VLTARDLASVQVLEEPAHRVDTSHGALWATNAPTFGATLTRIFDQQLPSDVGPTEVADSLDGAGRQRPAHSAAGDEGTSTVAAVDATGNAVVIVHSLSFPQYGSGLVIPGYNLVLSNRAGRGFVFDPDHPASPAPGRRPPITLHAWGMHRHDGWLLGATPGGRQQVPWNVQVIARLFARHQDPAADAMSDALSSPRWELESDGSTRLEGRDIEPLGARSGHTLVHLGSGQCTAGADPRWDGTAVAV
jgi:gamma-glutamyltranspeptidase/glutathione hydrolase